MQSRAPTSAGSNPATKPCTSAANTANGRTPTPTARGSRTRSFAGVTAGLLVLSSPSPIADLEPRRGTERTDTTRALTTTSASSIEKGKDTSIPKGCDSRSSGVANHEQSDVERPAVRSPPTVGRLSRR